MKQDNVKNENKNKNIIGEKTVKTAIRNMYGRSEKTR